MTTTGTTVSFGDISNERQWEWDREIEILRDFIESKGLDAEMVAFARKVADEEKAAECHRCGEEPDPHDMHTYRSKKGNLICGSCAHNERRSG
jgi:formylmethanofuran dehydrogenase subunit E